VQVNKVMKINGYCTAQENHKLNLTSYTGIKPKVPTNTNAPIIKL